jgi:hypothetical protein
MATNTDQISIVIARVPGHGAYAVPPHALDRAIARYLPASPAGLQNIATERTGIDYSDVETVAELLVILADHDEYSDSYFTVAEA